MSKSILLFEDKLGISSGYEGIWQSLLLKTGLTGFETIRRNSFRSLGNKVQLLERQGNRKAPGFNRDSRSMAVVDRWARNQIRIINPSIVLCMDPAILFLCNPNWDQATLDNLRGGVYTIESIPFLIMLPISTWHTQKKESDIARMNDGFTIESEWDEERQLDEDELNQTDMNRLWIEPVVVPYGRFILSTDLSKAKRIIERLGR